MASSVQLTFGASSFAFGTNVTFRAANNSYAWQGLSLTTASVADISIMNAGMSLRAALRVETPRSETGRLAISNITVSNCGSGAIAISANRPLTSSQLDVMNCSVGLRVDPTPRSTAPLPSIVTASSFNDINDTAIIAERLVLSNTFVSRANTGLDTRESEWSVTVTNCTFDTCNKGMSAGAYDLQVLNSTFVDTNHSIELFDVDANQFASVVVQDSTFERCQFGMYGSEEVEDVAVTIKGSTFRHVMQQVTGLHLTSRRHASFFLFHANTLSNCSARDGAVVSLTTEGFVSNITSNVFSDTTISTQSSVRTHIPAGTCLRSLMVTLGPRAPCQPLRTAQRIAQYVCWHPSVCWGGWRHGC